MLVGYYEPGYIEDDYYEEEVNVAVTQLPEAPLRSDAPEVFIAKADAFLSALVPFSVEMEAVILAMNNNATNSTSVTSNAIASSGSKTFTVETGKSYLPGHSVKAAATADGTTWMQGDVTAYNVATGVLTLIVNASQGSGTYVAWTLTLSISVANPTGSLSNDFAVKSLTYAVGAAIATASTINLSTATGNLVHLTGSATVAAATMTAGKSVLAIIDGTPQFTYHATNLRLNSGGANVTLAAGDLVHFIFDGVTVKATIYKQNGKPVVETAAPAGPPVGSGLIHFGSSAPTNHLVVPTAPTNISRTTYATLFAAIGTTWGAGDGSTTFGLPWFPADYAMVQASANVGSSTVGQVISHTHSGVALASASNDRGSLSSQVTLDTLGNTGASGGSANLAAGMRILICIRYQ